MKTVMEKLVDVHQMAFLQGRQIMDATLLANELVDSRFSVLINGNPEGFFQSSRALRQRDPLSPFLFLLAMEGLNYMIRKAKTNGWIKGFGTQTNRGKDMESTHLLYVDDCLVFSETKVTDLQFMASNLSCQTESLPTKYLGMPLGANHKAQEIWNDVLERCEMKLTSWKSQYLSLGGRLTLINSVLDALPTYMMSLLPIPRGIEKKINKVRREFLWHGNKDKSGVEDCDTQQATWWHGD
ncbi:uncharacterized protein LOC132053699 [Lycium ferocissimum]|uniref:uncharacterized protein LOC132053699 n=1 Tax=Lycium ferocissimum TaxID=112874 RepID=UPI0028162B42|nr:uncharacterized protein LOC132053699 [Lycium ferocissimum]